MSMENNYTEFGVILQNILKKIDFFSNLSSQEIIELSELVRINSYEQNDVIVKEDDVINAIYFVVKGQVTIWKRDSETEISRPLQQGQNIGISELEASSYGRYAATFVALTPVVLIRLTVTQMQNFFEQHPEKIEQTLVDRVRILARVNFIRKVDQFVSMPADKLLSYAEKIKELTFLKDQTLFNEGEIGEQCFLIESGLIEISTKKAGDDKKIIAQLEPDEIFGETALLLNTPRNATARILENAKLLVIDKNLFLELIKEESGFAARSLMKLQQGRARPLKYDYIEEHKQTKADGTIVTILFNPKLEKYLSLSIVDEFIWQRLDGMQSIDDITLAFFEEHKVFNPDLITQSVVGLAHEGYTALQNQLYESPAIQSLSGPLRLAVRIKKIMEYMIPLGQADVWISNSYNKFFHFFFTVPAQIFWILLVTSGLIVFIAKFAAMDNLLSSFPNKWTILAWVYAGFFFMIPLHELGHAYATKYYGRKVNSFGIGWFWLTPTAFCDTSNMWLANYKQRLWVDFAGMYVNFIVAGAACIALLFISDRSPMAVVLWLFALLNYIVIIVNFNPVFETDGYYLIMDYLDKYNLKKHSIDWLLSSVLAKNKPPTYSFRRDVAAHKEAAIYWSLVLFFIFIVRTIIPYIFASYLIHGFFSIESFYISLGLAVLFCALSALGMWGDVKKARQLNAKAQLP